MGEELSLARKEEEGQSVLLASSGIRESIKESASRDSGQESSDTTKGSKGGKAKYTQAKSKSSIKAKGVDASSSKTKGHRRDNKDRKQNRRNEGKDSKLRRSAQELGITWLDSECEVAKYHFLKEYDKVDGGVIFQCQYCHKVKWLPLSYDDAVKMGELMRKLGNQAGYCHFLNLPSHRMAKIMVAKLQELERISKSVGSPMEMARIAGKILNAKDYDSIHTIHSIILDEYANYPEDKKEKVDG